MSNEASNIRNTLVATAAAIQIATDITQFIGELALQHKENRLIALIGEHVSVGGKLDCQECASFVISDYSNLLSQNGIPHFVIYEKVTGTPLMITRDTDRDAVVALKNSLLLQEHRVTRVTFDNFAKIHQGEDVGVISARSAVEAKLFQQYAASTGMEDYAFKKNELEPSKVDIYFSREKEAEAHQTMTKVITATSGHNGAHLQESVANEMAANHKLTSRINDTKDDFYVVSKLRPTEYLHFTAKGFDHYKNGNLINHEDRTSADFHIAAKMCVSGMFVPVSMDKADFELSEEHRKAVLETTKTPYVPKTENPNLAFMENAAKELIDTKLVFDGGKEIPKEFFSPESSFSSFFKAKELDNSSKDLIEKMDALGWEDRGLLKSYMAHGVEEREMFKKCLANIEKGEAMLVISPSTLDSVVIDKTGMRCYDKNKKLTSERAFSNRFFQAAAMAETKNLHYPIYVKESEWENAKQIVEERVATSGMETQRAAELERLARQLFEKKLSLDKADPSKILSDITNPEVTLGEYMQIRNASDKSSQDINQHITEISEKDAIIMKSYIVEYAKNMESVDVHRVHIMEQNISLDNVLNEDATHFTDDYSERIGEYDEYEDERDFDENS